LARAAKEQVLERAAKEQVLERAAKEQVLERAAKEQVLERAAKEQVLERVLEQAHYNVGASAHALWVPLATPLSRLLLVLLCQCHGLDAQSVKGKNEGEWKKGRKRGSGSKGGKAAKRSKAKGRGADDNRVVIVTMPEGGDEDVDEDGDGDKMQGVQVAGSACSISFSGRFSVEPLLLGTTVL
jgi:hypothetical protein